ncbi:hypothetical protein ACFCWT_13245 [Streptomyces olivaceus]|uniref:hypothetical protein n=1 Tax=Streptomyces olivaceus TaxID=47716 RepID=UPI0035D6AC4D
MGVVLGGCRWFGGVGMSAPLVINTVDGSCWTRRTVTSGGIALYAPAAVRTCPEFVMATEAELAERGIVGSADVLPMPAGPEPQAAASLPWAHVMVDDDLHLFLDDLVAAAMNRWRTEPDGSSVPDRVTLTLVEKACAAWRTPGRGLRSDEPERDPVEELIGANLSLYEEELVSARLRLALASAQRGRRAERARVAEREKRIARLESDLGEATARVAGLEEQLADQQRAVKYYADQSARRRARVAELEGAPLAFAEQLDAKSLDNFLIALASATEHEPMGGAVARIHELIASYREPEAGDPS